MGVILAISNQKGGVSKTVSTFNLGAALALKYGKKVLLCDIDPQANLTDYLGYIPDGQPTMTQLIMYTCMNKPLTSDMVQSTIHHCDNADVDYIPADINLAGCETMMTTAISRETILRRILSTSATTDYDFILIDCLPSLGSLLINALAAADKVLIPVQTQKFSMDGLQALETLFQQIKSTINPNVNFLGVLPTMVDRTKISREAVDTLHEKYGELVFDTNISKSVDAAKSTVSKIPLCLTDSKLGTEYMNLAMEVLERC